MFRDFAEHLWNTYLTEKAGDIGLEIELEMEGCPYIRAPASKHWIRTSDGSLRGEGYEYVLREPVPIDSVPEAMHRLYKLFECPHNMPVSDRCGVHVHINVQRLTPLEIFNFVCLYLVFEDLLIEWCGPERMGNLFCLRSRDSLMPGFWLTQVAKDIDKLPMYFKSDVVRYASLNLASLFKYGSLEFRGMRTPENWDDILTWVNILWKLREGAAYFKAPWEILEQCSAGPEQFFRKIFAPYDELLETPTMESDIYNAIRLIQPAIYSFNVERYRKLKNRVAKSKAEFIEAERRIRIDADGLAHLVNIGGQAPNIGEQAQRVYPGEGED